MAPPGEETKRNRRRSCTKSILYVENSLRYIALLAHQRPFSGSSRVESLSNLVGIAVGGDFSLSLLCLSCLFSCSFAEGVGRGITSALAKPLAGGLDMVSQPVAGLANVITSQNNSYDPVPRRPPRRLGRQGEIPEFDWRREIGNALFAHYLPSAPYNSQFVGWTELTAEAGSQNRQYLSDLWQVFSRYGGPGKKKKGEKRGRPSLRDV